LTPGGSNTVHIYKKQYTEQHIETKYPEQNEITVRIHKYKNKK